MTPCEHYRVGHQIVPLLAVCSTLCERRTGLYMEHVRVAVSQEHALVKFVHTCRQRKIWILWRK
jgi:hypothetical protein